ncbi:MAG: hypothetical protein L6R37_008429 [Teloschistes peruensis]|nr:MAG: hypothetical protein L6R37_008429 [Teloschistes peruensis]
MPARPAADTATARVAMGAGEESISRPPAEPMEGLIWKERLGSGMAKMAAKKDRANDVMVDSRIEWTYPTHLLFAKLRKEQRSRRTTIVGLEYGGLIEGL